VAVGWVDLVLPLDGTVVLVTWFFTGTVCLDLLCVVTVDAGRVVELSALVERDEVRVVCLGGVVCLVGAADFGFVVVGGDEGG
jgi:hypothetical protein